MPGRAPHLDAHGHISRGGGAQYSTPMATSRRWREPDARIDALNRSPSPADK